jgi:histidyl-tRNA synthetase
MSKLDTSPYKGVRDFYPEDQFIQNHIFTIWRKIAERFGYEEYNASPLEPTEIYTEKSGDEIVNDQTFTFTDRGDRSVTLRPEMTPTTARLVAARRRELSFPLRWYSIPNIFRYEAPQRGRLREHWQLNVDVFGIDGIEADIELIVLADRIMKSFGAKSEDYEIRLNTYSKETGELEMLIDKLKKLDVPNTVIDSGLKRGQAYYTGVVFEFFDTNPANPRSILGGGRYNNLTFLFGDNDLAAAGFGAGDVTIRDFLETHGLLPTYTPATKLYICLTDPSLFGEVAGLIRELRVSGVNVAVDFSGRKLGDQIKSADKHKIPFIIVLGEDEIKTGKYKIKNLANGDEEFLSQDELIEKLK